jgi:hypothetical protein
VTDDPQTTGLSEVPDIVQFPPKDKLPNDPQAARIAELEETLSQTRIELGHALNAVHKMRRWLLQIRTITNNVNFDVV